MLKKFLIDTDIFVDFFHDQSYAKKLISKLAATGSIKISTITIAELRAGFNEKQAEVLLPDLYLLADVNNVTRQIAEIGGKIRYDHRTKGIPLSTTDTLIAATAILEKCQLVTRNKKDFPIKEIKFYQFSET